MKLAVATLSIAAALAFSAAPASATCAQGVPTGRCHCWHQPTMAGGTGHTC